MHKYVGIATLLAAISVSAGTFASDTQALLPDWEDYLSELLPLGDQALEQISGGDDPALEQELYGRMISAMSVAYMGLFLGDSEHPVFWPIFNYGHNLGTPNPDNAYYLAPIDDQGSYRISGERGTVRIADLQIGGGYFYPRGEGPLGKTFVNIDIDDLETAADGTFEIVISPSKPENYQGNWRRMPTGATNILVRQIAYDWAGEKDGRYAIERLDTPAIRPRPDARELSEALKQFAVWVKTWTQTTNAMASRVRQAGLINQVRVIDFADSGGFDKEKQLYIEGVYNLGEDEALVLTVDIPPNCRYWNVQLTGMVTWSAIDPVNRQSSLNGHSATLTEGHQFVGVVSAIDPGVPNWLDNAGYREGTIFGRFMECDGSPRASAQKIKVVDINDYVPEGTPRVSPAVRDNQIRVRREAAQKRHYW
jgi:hypothetical protein